MDKFRQISNFLGVDYDFVITSNSPFDSNVRRLSTDAVMVKYRDFEFAKPAGKIMSTYSLNKENVLTKFGKQKVYFLFLNRGNKEKISPVTFINHFKEMIK